jgi:hypothetical protein
MQELCIKSTKRTWTVKDDLSGSASDLQSGHTWFNSQLDHYLTRLKLSENVSNSLHTTHPLIQQCIA